MSYSIQLTTDYVSHRHENINQLLNISCPCFTISDCPVVPTKWKYVEGQRIKKMITKNVNRKVEEEIRSVVTDAPKVYQSNKKKQLKQTVPQTPAKTVLRK